MFWKYFFKYYSVNLFILILFFIANSLIFLLDHITTTIFPQIGWIFKLLNMAVSIFNFLIFINITYLFFRRIINPKKEIDMTFYGKFKSMIIDFLWREKNILQKYHDSHWTWLQKNRVTDAFIGIY